jgi:hypothetical protein
MQTTHFPPGVESSRLVLKTPLAYKMHCGEKLVCGQQKKFAAGGKHFLCNREIVLSGGKNSVRFTISNKGF